MMQTKKIPVVEEFIRALEPVIRRVVREELNAIVEQRAGIFHLDPDSPLYDDLTELKERNKCGGPEFIPQEEAFQ